MFRSSEHINNSLWRSSASVETRRANEANEANKATFVDTIWFINLMILLNIQIHIVITKKIRLVW